MNTRLKPFDIVKDLINQCGYEVSYYYDDLIFSDHSLFIIQFDDKNPEILKLFFNRDCDIDVKIKIKDKLYKDGKEKGMDLRDEGMFYLTEDEESKEISIHYV